MFVIFCDCEVVYSRMSFCEVMFVNFCDCGIIRGWVEPQGHWRRAPARWVWSEQNDWILESYTMWKYHEDSRTVKSDWFMGVILREISFASIVERMRLKLQQSFSSSTWRSTTARFSSFGFSPPTTQPPIKIYHHGLLLHRQQSQESMRPDSMPKLWRWKHNQCSTRRSWCLLPLLPTRPRLWRTCVVPERCAWSH